ncbi:SixA phosphatase family protein [Sulfurimonas sp. CS5]|uniref:SixA phosphatase family protein n=1 Tax=Sulfurimonas sp. CS5 TaxID=3391145 RepID=UPI0039E818C1
MKRLFIIRHAKSSWKNSSLNDFDRPLNGRGKKNAPLMGRRLRKRHVIPDIFISSPALRAKTTAEIIAQKVKYSKEIIYDDNIYASAEIIIDKIIKKVDDKHKTVFLLGHNPDLNMFVEDYVDFDENIVTCGVVEIEFDCKSWKDISRKKAKFISFDYPKKEQE